jgi:hypothetical protein
MRSVPRLHSKAENYFFQHYSKSEIKIPRPLSQATTSKHSNAFTFTLLLSEGRAGEA